MVGFINRQAKAPIKAPADIGEPGSASGAGPSVFARLIRAILKRRYLTIFLVLAVTINIFALIGVYSVPELRHLVTHEDNLVENLTALAFLIAVIGVVVLLFKRRTPRRFRKWLWFIGPVALLGLLDELSFGQRIFELNSLDFRGNGIDAVHDFLLVAYEAASDYARHQPVTMGLVILSLVIVTAAAVWLARRWIIHRFTLGASREIWALFSVFVALIATSQFLDLEILSFYRGFAVLIEELFEMEAALVLVFMLLAITDPFKLYSRTTDTAAPRSAASAAAGKQSIDSLDGRVRSS